MKSTELLLTQDAQVLATQMEAWSAIVSLSSKIAAAVAKGQWVRVLEMAEDRDNRVEGFFEQGIAKDIFLLVVADLELMKQQHGQILVALEQSQLQNKEKELFLHGLIDGLKEQVGRSVPSGPLA